LYFYIVYHCNQSILIAIPGFRDSRITESRKFSNLKIPGLNRTHYRDFGINQIYLFDGLYSTFSEREREFTFAPICRRPSVCLSVVCNVRAPYLVY